MLLRDHEQCEVYAVGCLAVARRPAGSLRRQASLRRILPAVPWWALLLFVVVTGASAQNAPQSEELYRIRVTNAAGGAVEASGDGGETYTRVGKVVTPATRLIQGFAASRWAPVGSVAATAIHGLRLKVRNSTPKDPKGVANCMMMSLVPREFHTIPKGYGGHRPGNSGIYTDIPAGQGIFRNLAPLVASPVRLEREGRLAPFPADYQPRVGDRIVILVYLPPVLPREIVFENWKGGRVTAHFEGRDPHPIARVARPVLGVGRYDGTAYTGVGRINTNHCGVITVSTAPVSGSLLPEGQGSERRGGFQIEPADHARAVSYNAPQVMVVEPLEGQGALEGQPPLFAGYIGLQWDQRSVAHSLGVEVKIDNGPWEPMPELVGVMNDAFAATALMRHFRKLGVARRITSGVTHLRLVFPRLDRAAVARYLAEYGTPAPAEAAPGDAEIAGPTEPATPVHGFITLNASFRNPADLQRIAVVTVYVDGRIVAIMNVAPFRHQLDTRRLTNGRHEVELRALDGQGGIVAQKKMSIMVENAASEGGAPAS
jgi:hypothetical protein